VNHSTPTPKKSLGQHWLHDPTVCARIVGLSKANAQNHVFEIGPGAGVLTRGLLDSGAQVTALETDLAAISFLTESFASEVESGQLIILEGDGRKVTLPVAPSGKWSVVSNLPYNVGSIIFLNLLNQRDLIHTMVLMFQAEVSQRILAQPGTKSHGFLSVLTSLEWKARRGLMVRPGAFHPPPRVQSEVIVLEPHLDATGWGQPRDAFRTFIDTCFRPRRKMLRNVLTREGFDDDAVRAAFAAAELSDKTRAEAIPSEKFTTLFYHLTEHGLSDS